MSINKVQAEEAHDGEVEQLGELKALETDLAVESVSRTRFQFNLALK